MTDVQKFVRGDAPDPRSKVEDGERNRVPTQPGKSWKVMELKCCVFQAWKVMEFSFGHGKSWKSHGKLNDTHGKFVYT